MFSKLAAAFTTLAAVTAVLATPFPGGDTTVIHNNYCEGGSVACCNSVQSTDNYDYTDLYGLLDIVAGPVTSQIGINCNPITVLGAAGGSKCTQNTLCCQDNSFNGVIAVGCSPIILS